MAAFDDLQQLIDLLAEAPSISKLTVSGPGGAEITIRKHAASAGSIGQAPSAAAPAMEDSVQEPALDPTHDEGRVKPHTVTANRVGIFRSPRPRIEIGGAVTKGQIVGYIESMKLMNEVTSDRTGTFSDEYVEDGHPVEYGQPLIVIT